MNTNRREGRRGFTLMELLVVVLIIVLVSAATLPVVIPALTHRQVSEAARILQASIAGARDAAIRSNAPRGIRLLPDPAFPGPSLLAANRMVSIETAPDYTSGLINIPLALTATVTDPISNTPSQATQLRIVEAVLDTTTSPSFPNEPTSWYWNIRQGDKIRFDDSGRYYTVAGPMINGVTSGNPERYVNYGPPGYVDNGSGGSVQNDLNPLSANHFPEYLIVTNGQDDNGNGFVDEGFDGLDNDGDGIIDPAFNPNVGNPVYSNRGEYEDEKFIGSQFSAPLFNQKYTIFRRPVVSESAREVALPQGVVIDLTSWNAPSGIPERSRLPIDPFTYYVDVMFAPNGEMMVNGPTSSAPSLPFYHFWLAEREDVYEPIWGVLNGPAIFGPIPNPNAPSFIYVLPMPQGTLNYTPPQPSGPYLKGDRRLVSLFVKSGLVVTNSIETFNGGDINVPYYSPQLGTRE